MWRMYRSGWSVVQATAPSAVPCPYARHLASLSLSRPAPRLMPGRPSWSARLYSSAPNQQSEEGTNIFKLPNRKALEEKWRNVLEERKRSSGLTLQRQRAPRRPDKRAGKEMQSGKGKVLDESSQKYFEAVRASYDKGSQTAEIAKQLILSQTSEEIDKGTLASNPSPLYSFFHAITAAARRYYPKRGMAPFARKGIRAIPPTSLKPFESQYLDVVDKVLPTIKEKGNRYEAAKRAILSCAGILGDLKAATVIYDALEKPTLVDKIVKFQADREISKQSRLTTLNEFIEAAKDAGDVRVTALSKILKFSLRNNDFKCYNKVFDAVESGAKLGAFNWRGLAEHFALSRDAKRAEQLVSKIDNATLEKILYPGLTRDLMQTLVQSSPALVKQLYDHIPAESRIETDHLSVIISLAYAGDGIATVNFLDSLDAENVHLSFKSLQYIATMLFKTRQEVNDMFLYLHETEASKDVAERAAAETDDSVANAASTHCVNVWNVMMLGYGYSGDLNLAYSSMMEMKNLGLKPNASSYLVLIDACMMKNEYNSVRMMLLELQDTDMWNDPEVVMMRIDYARKTRDDAKLHEILQQSKSTGKKLPPAAYPVIASYFGRNGQWEKGLEAVELAVSHGVTVTTDTMLLIAKARLPEGQKADKQFYELFEDLRNWPIDDAVRSSTPSKLQNRGEREEGDEGDEEDEEDEGDEGDEGNEGEGDEGDESSGDEEVNHVREGDGRIL